MSVFLDSRKTSDHNPCFLTADHNNLSLKNTEFIPISNLSLPRKITDENLTPETSCHLIDSLPVIALDDSHLTPAAVVGDGK